MRRILCSACMILFCAGLPAWSAGDSSDTAPRRNALLFSVSGLEDFGVRGLVGAGITYSRAVSAKWALRLGVEGGGSVQQPADDNAGEASDVESQAASLGLTVQAVRSWRVWQRLDLYAAVGPRLGGDYTYRKAPYFWEESQGFSAGAAAALGTQWRVAPVLAIILESGLSGRYRWTASNHDGRKTESNGVSAGFDGVKVGFAVLF